MTHLSNSTGIAVSLFYSALTFFIVPHLLTNYTSFTKKMKDPCLVGFVVGFVLSILLWINVGRKYVMKNN